MAYHKDITEYFILPYSSPTSTQTQIQSAYSSICSSINSCLISGPEKSVALRKLLESFDAAMRAAA